MFVKTTYFANILKNHPTCLGFFECQITLIKQIITKDYESVFF